jgi:hypothetical protein
MSVIDRPYSEKRNFIRMKINSPVTIVHEGNSYQATCKDLSGAGMQLESDGPFSIGDELQVTIQQSGDNRLPFNAIVEVTRVQDSETGKQAVGLSIKEIID